MALCAGFRFGVRGFGGPRTQFSSIATRLDGVVDKFPHLEVFHFTKAGLKWSTADVQKYSSAFAAGLLEDGFRPGDALATWLPKDGAEAHATKFAAARIGLLLVEVDLSISDPNELAAILNETKSKGLIFDDEVAIGPVGYERNATDILAVAMPEMLNYDSQYGRRFRSRSIPAMKILIHTGIDKLPASQNMKFMMTYDPMASIFPSPPSEEDPFTVNFTSSGKSPVLSQVEALETPQWSAVKAALAKQHTSLSGKRGLAPF